MLPEPILPEPWMRGIVPGIDPVIGHLLRASEHIREDLERAIALLSKDQLWATPKGMTAAGFHAKHLAGSTERLCTYLEGGQLSAGQLAALNAEGAGNETAAELIERVKAALARYETLVRVLTPEHGQRHVGQAISAAKLALA